jgi:23S rRNA-/tRNA-specific pseudouridylate synthase
VAALVDCSLQKANELIEIGAVWARMEALTERDVLSLYGDGGGAGSSSSIRAVYADLPRGWGGGDSDPSGGGAGGHGHGDEVDLDEYVELVGRQRFRRVLSPGRVELGTDLRVYPEPRRFPACRDVTPGALLHEDATFLVVDKPPMLPTQPDASNYRENCPGCVESQLGIPRPLLCHRVDACVGGCVVLAKSVQGQKVFHRLQRERKLRKVYLAVTTAPVPTGLHVHWMWAGQSAGRGAAVRAGPACRLVRHAPPESRRRARRFWKRCVLEVVDCGPIEISSETAAADGHDYRPPAGTRHYQSTIRLVTGRKHQVRAQLASLGCPVVRDTLYGPVAGLTLDLLEEESAEVDADAAVAQCRVPTEPIGLQAAGILFGGVRARARTPWWGDRVPER